jgi:hypothetical protein
MLSNVYKQRVSFLTPTPFFFVAERTLRTTWRSESLEADARGPVVWMAVIARVYVYVCVCE